MERGLPFLHSASRRPNDFESASAKTQALPRLTRARISRGDASEGRVACQRMRALVSEDALHLRRLVCETRSRFHGPARAPLPPPSLPPCLSLFFILIQPDRGQIDFGQNWRKVYATRACTAMALRSVHCGPFLTCATRISWPPSFSSSL